MEENKEPRFESILKDMLGTYKAKNADYGDSFSKTVEKYGLIAGLTRISDKFNRLENLVLSDKKPKVKESLSDTLIDLANYCIMLTMEL